MDTQQVSDYVNNIKIPAPQLLSEIDPNLSKRFQRALNGLDKLINEIREHYPDACYYVNDDQVNLMLGRSHTNIYCGDSLKSIPNRHLVADCSSKLIGKIGGDGW